MNLRDIEHIVEMSDSSELRELAQGITDEELQGLEAQNRHVFEVVSLLVVGLGGYLTYRRVERSKPLACQVCQRPIHQGQPYRVEFTDGTGKTACCPRCGIRDQLGRPEKSVWHAFATDHTTGKWIPAKEAHYVEGSDGRYCNPHPAPLREPGAAYEMTFDRCLPSLVAFRTEQEARAFQARHGGRVISYREAVESVKQW